MNVFEDEEDLKRMQLQEKKTTQPAGKKREKNVMKPCSMISFNFLSLIS